MITKHEIINVKFKQINCCFAVSHSQEPLSERRGHSRVAGELITNMSINRKKANFQQRLHRGRRWKTASSITGPRPAQGIGLAFRYVASTPPVSVLRQDRLLYNYSRPERVLFFIFVLFLLLIPLLQLPLCRHHLLVVVVILIIIIIIIIIITTTMNLGK